MNMRIFVVMTEKEKGKPIVTKFRVFNNNNSTIMETTAKALGLANEFLCHTMPNTKRRVEVMATEAIMRRSSNRIKTGVKK